MVYLEVATYRVLGVSREAKNCGCVRTVVVLMDAPMATRELWLCLWLRLWLRLAVVDVVARFGCCCTYGYVRGCDYGCTLWLCYGCAMAVVVHVVARCGCGCICGYARDRETRNQKLIFT